jgi:hypothetical protein
MMKKPFDIRDAINYQYAVSKSRLKLRDNRTGEIREEIVFHPGDCYPLSIKRKDIELYGFSVVSCEAEDTVIGDVPWEEIFCLLQKKEKDEK